MPPTERRESSPGHFHAVQFYQDDDALCRTVADFLAEALLTGRPAVAITTPVRRIKIVRELGARACDTEALLRTGDLLVVDVREASSISLANKTIDPAVFRTRIGSLIEQASRRCTHGVVRVYGDMVDLLWRSGLCQAAVRLEALWDEFATEHKFWLLCSYSINHFQALHRFECSVVTV